MVVVVVPVGYTMLKPGLYVIVERHWVGGVQIVVNGPNVAVGVKDNDALPISAIVRVRALDEERDER